MSDYNRRLGQYGEKLAAQFLIRRGYQIIDHNFNTPLGEIDLIAKSGDEILFVEVKTRTASAFGYPELAVDRRKVDHLSKAAKIWLTKNNLSVCWRLVIVAVEINKQKQTAKISWFNNLYGY